MSHCLNLGHMPESLSPASGEVKGHPEQRGRIWLHEQENRDYVCENQTKLLANILQHSLDESVNLKTKKYWTGHSVRVVAPLAFYGHSGPLGDRADVGFFLSYELHEILENQRLPDIMETMHKIISQSQ